MRINYCNSSRVGGYDLGGFQREVFGVRRTGNESGYRLFSSLGQSRGNLSLQEDGRGVTR